MFDLSGKSALVTGASGGIGGAICRAFHAQGAAVMATGRRKAALDELAASLGERTWVHDCDLTDPDAPAGLVKEAESAMGAVDILVNNAGRTRDGLLVRMSDEEVRLPAPGAAGDVAAPPTGKGGSGPTGFRRVAAPG